MHGATGNINVWQPQVHPSEVSIAQFWITDNGPNGYIESIEAGYMVTPFNPEPIVFIYWTMGISQMDATIWTVLGEDIGYWPSELFKNLKTTSKLIEWGGNVINTKVGRFETASEMGSGHYPTEGFGKAAFFINLGILNEDGEFVDADGVVVQATKPGCYNIDLNDKTENWGTGEEMSINLNPHIYTHNDTFSEMGSGHFATEGLGKEANFMNLKYVDQDGVVNNADEVTGRATKPSCYGIHVQKWTPEFGVHFFYGGPGRFLSQCK
ncbi:hypothetical protein LINPERPRIM_LOCUS19278 [Linum perenne]